MKNLSDYLPQSGGSGLFDLVKVTAYDPGHAAFTGVTEVEIFGFADYEYLSSDTPPAYSACDGTYTVTQQTGGNSALKDRVFYNSAAHLYLYFCDGSDFGGTDYWCIASSTATPFYEALACVSAGTDDTIPASAVWNVNHMLETVSGVAATPDTTTIPAVAMTLTGQPITGYSDALGVRTFTASGTGVSFTAADDTPVVGGLALVSGTRLLKQLLPTLVQPVGGLLRWAPFSADAASDPLGVALSKTADSGIAFGTDSGIPCVACAGVAGIGYASGLTMTACTISVWMYGTSSSYPACLMIGPSSGDSVGDSGRMLWLFDGSASNSGRVWLWNSYGDYTGYFLKAESVSTGWKHVTVVWTGTQFGLYIDGVQQGDFVTKGIHFEDVSCGVCMNDTFHPGYRTRSHHGRYAGLRLYDRVLSASEIAALAGEFTPTSAS